MIRLCYYSSDSLADPPVSRSGISELSFAIARRSFPTHADLHLNSYIPIKSDYSDLTDAAAFFIGAPDGTGSHDALAKKIALNGKQWTREHWTESTMAAYQFRLCRLLGRRSGMELTFPPSAQTSSSPGFCTATTRVLTTLYSTRL